MVALLKPRVVVGMSSGVDSTVSALLLKQKGYNVHGVFMSNWDSRNETGQCPSAKEWNLVQDTCRKLKISCSRVDFAKEYWMNVFDPFIDGLSIGEMPNPDIKCNSRIKFDVFHKYCLDQLGADLVAFGHYARVQERDKWYLLKGLDANKDQTYYLSDIDYSVLRTVVFPVGELQKDQVKAIALENGLETVAKQKESMGICFIGKRSFGSFVGDYIDQKPGNFIKKDGKILGTYPGIGLFTIGQRAPIGGKKWFIAHKNIDQNTITVVDSLDDPWLYKKKIECRLHWISGQPDLSATFDIKYRYRSDSKKGKIYPNGLIEFEDHGHCLAVGQQVAIYRDEICYGGGPITKIH